jgi:3-isopropylmalate/(R)-2-methylmalate dehydratase small subunit
VGLFSAWRESDPDFPLNRPEYEGAKILIAGPNFGVGSSREHAVWALSDYGFQAVVSPRFGDIFRNNATKTGLVPVVVSPEFAEALMQAVEQDPGLIVEIDVAERWISAPTLGLEESFPLDDFTVHRLVEGLDDIGLTLQKSDKITAFERTRPAWMPSVAPG